MVFIGCRLTDRKGGSVWKAKLSANKEVDLLSDFVRRGIRRFRKKDAGVESAEEEDAAVEEAFSRVSSVSCDGCDLTDLLKDPNATLDALNSSDTPIFASGIDIRLLLNSTGNAKKKAKVCAHDVLLGKVDLGKDNCFLKCEIDMDEEYPLVHHQIQQRLYSLFEDIDLGYCDDVERVALKGNAELLQSTLCFIQKYWKVILRADFPRIPDTDDYPSSKLLMVLTTTIRHKNKMCVSQLDCFIFLDGFYKMLSQ